MHGPPPGILTPSKEAMNRSGFMYNNPNNAQSVLSTQSQGQQGTQIDERGVVTINIIVDDAHIPFLAGRDSVRFLQALFPGWSTPAFVGGISIPNEVGATYSLEKHEKKMLDNYDGAQDEVNIKRKLTIIIREILNEPTVKRIIYEVKAKLVSDVYTEPFEPVSYISLDIAPFRFEQGKFHFKLKFDGGPPLVKMKTTCFGCTSPESLRQQEHAEEMKPYIYQQADSVIQYITHFNPNDPVARQVIQHMDYSSNNFDDENSYAGSGSKLSGSKLSKGSNPGRFQGGRNNSKGMLTSVVSSNLNSISSADEIKKYYELYKAGALSKAEYEAEKRRILSNGAVTQNSFGSNLPPTSPAPSFPGNNFF